MQASERIVMTAEILDRLRANRTLWKAVSLRNGHPCLRAPREPWQLVS